MAETSLIPSERIEKAILLIRGQKVLLDSDLASLYGVQVKVLNQAVKRNITRFPGDFMIQLTSEEAEALRSQIVTLWQIAFWSHKERFLSVKTDNILGA